ncbi:MAG: hypothetical protein LBE24_10660 [Methylobacillus sp.]|jgi:hypothetical protein|nr:hypothetical protein [Methylobacillus sp.]
MSQLDIREFGRFDTIVVEQDIPDIVTEGVQGPPGRSGLDGSSDTRIRIEAGEFIPALYPVRVSGGKVYKTDNMSAAVIGLCAEDTQAGFVAEVVFSGGVAATGLVPGAVYFVSDNGISISPPTVGYQMRVGRAARADLFIVNLDLPILLN